MQAQEPARRSAQLPRLVELVHTQRWAALATLDPDGQPFASMVAYAVNPEGGLLLHLSRLAAHTRHLEARPRVALVISEADCGHGDPQTLARVTLQGEVRRVDPEAADYATDRAAYLARLPDAEPLFSFGDFALFCITPTAARLVGGFAQAFSYPAGELGALAKGPSGGMK